MVLADVEDEATALEFDGANDAAGKLEVGGVSERPVMEEFEPPSSRKLSEALNQPLPDGREVDAGMSTGNADGAVASRVNRGAKRGLAVEPKLEVEPASDSFLCLGRRKLAVLWLSCAVVQAAVGVVSASRTSQYKNR